MKKLFIKLSLMIVSISGFTQTLYIPSGTSGIESSTSDNVGIGINNPSAILTIRKDFIPNKAHLIVGNYLATSGQVSSLISFGGWGVQHAGFSWIPNTNYSNGKLNLAFGGSENAINNETKFTFQSNGHLGIGVITPIRKMHIGSGNNSALLLQGATEVGSTSELLFKASNTNMSDSYIKAGIYFERTADNALGNMHFAINNENNSNNVSLNDTRMTITRSGNIGIGTSETGTHKLAVEGTIGAREIKVEADSWSDFVFNKDYKLKDLEEVENFIAENNHLPDVPSEKEVKENGIQIGEMNAKLLQKIEELTLYMIEMNKEIKFLKQENSELKIKVENL